MGLWGSICVYGARLVGLWSNADCRTNVVVIMELE